MEDVSAPSLRDAERRHILSTFVSNGSYQGTPRQVSSLLKFIIIAWLKIDI